jgi:hypothetical protein
VSSIAVFTRLPSTSLHGLREAAVPRKRFLFGESDRFPGFLARYGQKIASYSFHGIFLATLLSLLEEKGGIDLMTSEHDELARSLTNTRGSSIFILTSSHRRFAEYLRKDVYSADELRLYFEEFNGHVEPAAGDALLEGIEALRTSIEATDDDHVVMLAIG